MNSEETLQQWLNAFEYHRDAGKRTQVEARNHALGSVKGSIRYVTLRTWAAWQVADAAAAWRSAGWTIFGAGLPVPFCRSSDFGASTVPPDGTPLAQYISDGLMDSLRSLITKGGWRVFH